MLTNYETMFGNYPNEFGTPKVEKDHPDIDGLGIKQYQSLIGALQ
jgi:hypothetical protein